MGPAKIGDVLTLSDGSLEVVVGTEWGNLVTERLPSQHETPSGRPTLSTMANKAVFDSAINEGVA